MSDGRPLLLLDFDGVVADTFHIGHSVARKLCVFVTESEYRKRFDGNINDAFDAIRAADHGDRCDHALDWLGAYLPEFKMHARPFPQMPELVKELSKTYTLLILSSTHDDLIAGFLEQYELREAVAEIYGVDVHPRKDEKLRMILSKYKVDPEDPVFVTDTLGDINEAASVGVSSIGVTWGFQDRATLERGNPIEIVEEPGELRSAIERHFARAVHEFALQ